MPRSNNPLALSVVTLTEPGDIQTTFERITAFDDREFGFNHNQTWSAMAAALRGVLKPDSVASSYASAPTRVRNCIKALCELGQAQPLETRRFVDFPDAGLKAVEMIEWDPEVAVRVKATCWYVADGKAHIPLLQPRKAQLDEERLAIYVELGRQAYCQGDWFSAVADLVDLSGDGPVVEARFVDISGLPAVAPRRIREFIETFIQAKKLADISRAKKPKKVVELPMGEILGIR